MAGRRGVAVLVLTAAALAGGLGLVIGLGAGIGSRALIGPGLLPWDVPRDNSQALAAPPICPEPARVLNRLELIFGTARRDGAPVDEAQWQAFVDDEISPRFPDGFTIHAAEGQWRAGGATGAPVRERAFVLSIWHEPTPAGEAAIEAIRAAYKERFAQESVLRADGVSCVSF